MLGAPDRSGRWLLAIDTSTEQAGIALTDGTRSVESSWWAGRDQTVTVLRQIDQLIELAGIAPPDVAAVAVATGPGMFNGLRVGLSLAKGWHLGSGAALIGISTFAVTAEPFRGLGRPVVPVVAAGRGRLNWQLDLPNELPTNGTISDLAGSCRRLEIGPIVTGDLGAEDVEVMNDVPGIVVPPVSARARRPAVLAEMGWRRYVDGAVDDPVSLAPVYIHAAPAPTRGRSAGSSRA